ncbi:MAG: AMP-binding protein, partial [SAR324 cluster bacterium]|nr:AMP-binding protein [SAR324 cluster bacterium]
MSQPLWTPSRRRVVSSNLYSFLLALRARHDIPDGEYGTLQRWSIDNLETFWEEAWLDAEVMTRAEHRAVLADRSMPVVRFEPDRQWFPGTRFNFARHLLRVRDELPALIAEGEAAPRRTVTYNELYEMVAQAAGGLQALGVAPGDRVAAYLPNTVEAVVAMLATTALGAVFSSTSPDFGYEGVLERFGQIDP